MSEISIRCDNCGRTLGVPQQALGLRVRCPDCGQPLDVAVQPPPADDYPVPAPPQAMASHPRARSRIPALILVAALLSAGIAGTITAKLWFARAPASTAASGQVAVATPTTPAPPAPAPAVPAPPDIPATPVPPAPAPATPLPPVAAVPAPTTTLPPTVAAVPAPSAPAVVPAGGTQSADTPAPPAPVAPPTVAAPTRTQPELLLLINEFAAAGTAPYGLSWPSAPDWAESKWSFYGVNGQPIAAAQSDARYVGRLLEQRFQMPAVLVTVSNGGCTVISRSNASENPLCCIEVERPNKPTLLAWFRPLALKTTTISDTRDGFAIRMPTQQVSRLMASVLLDGAWDGNIHFRGIRLPSDCGPNVRRDGGMLAVELAMTRDEKTLIARDINPGRVAEPDGNTRNAPVNGRERLAEIQRLQPLQQRDELRKFITAYETRLRELTDDARRQQLNTLLQELAQATYEIVDELYQRTGDSRGPRSTTGVSAGSDPFMRDTRLTQRDLDHSDRSVPGRTVSSKATAAQQRKLAELAEQAEKDHPAFFRETITSALPWDRDRTAWSRVIRLPELRALAALPFTAAPPAAQEDAAIQVGVLVPRRVTLSPRGNPQTTILTVDTTPRTNP